MGKKEILNLLRDINQSKIRLHMKKTLPDYNLFCSWCHGSIDKKDLQDKNALIILERHLFHYECANSIFTSIILQLQRESDELLIDGHLARCPVNTVSKEDECRCVEEEVLDYDKKGA